MSHPPSATKYEEDEMMMQLDDDMDAEGEDQLIDDETLSPPVRPGSSHASSAQQLTLDSRNNLNARRRNAPVGAQGSIDKSARKREQREREKEQQKLLLAKLIEIFEAGGGTCAVQQGQKKFPWVDLPAALIRIGCYFAGWPEKCLPKMSDKHPDRIDASTGPSQWSLKQKRAMEAQIAKGAVKVLPRPAHRAVIFEVVDDFGNVKDSTVEFSENWVRNKLLGHAMVANSPPAPHAVPHANYATEPRHMPSTTTPDVDYSPPNRSLALPPIRSNTDYGERLDLPSLSKSLSGLHTPEDGSRSPSPMSNFSEGRYHSASVHPGFRHSYYGSGKYPSASQDDLFPTRGRMLTLEHGLPRTAASLRSTSRPKTNYTLHHHPYSHAMASSSVSSIRSRPPSPLSVHNHSHSRSHSGVGPAPLNTSDTGNTYGIAPPRSATSNGASPSLASASGHQRFPSHVPNIPSSIVAWDAHSRGWILKLQNDVGFRSLPCQGNGLVYWHRDLDEWECRSAQQEVGRAVWNSQTSRWYLLLPPEEEVEGSLANPQFVRHAVFPTHIPLLEGECSYDSEHLRAWVFTPTPEAESQLPISPCTIVWSVSRKQWSLLPQSPQEADVFWSPEDRSWRFSMPGYLKSSRSTSPRPSSAPHSNVLPPMIIPPSSPIQSIKSPRSSVMRPMSTASSSF